MILAWLILISFMKKIFYKKQKGFSLLEVIVAASIVVVALLGLASLMLQSLRVGAINTNHMIASMLAQEGIEIVRNIRDSNWLMADNSWYQAIYYPDLVDASKNTYAVDRYSNSASASLEYDPDDTDHSEARLWLDANEFYVLHDNSLNPPNTTTMFYRLIEVSGLPEWSDMPDQLNVKSTVKWTERGQTNQHVAETNLYKWRSE